MITIEIILNQVAEFYQWLYSTLGLERWQFLSIAIAVIIMLTLIAIRQRKHKVKKIHPIHTKRRSEIIGIKLSGHGATHSSPKETHKHDSAFPSETDERQKGWGQTTKEWRKATEQIRQLKHEITKHKRTEEHLKHQISALTTANKKLQYQITEHKQAEKSSTARLHETARSPRQDSDEPPETERVSENLNLQPERQTMVDEQAQQETIQSEPTDQAMNQELRESAVLINEKFQEAPNKEETLPKDTKQQTVELTGPDVQHPQEGTEDNQTDRDVNSKIHDATVDTEQSRHEFAEHHQEEMLLTEEPEESEESEQHGVPLDIQELKAIAELAKRLRGNTRQ